MVKSKRQGNEVPSTTSEHISLTGEDGRRRMLTLLQSLYEKLCKIKRYVGDLISSIQMRIPDWKNISRRRWTDEQDHQRP